MNSPQRRRPATILGAIIAVIVLIVGSIGLYTWSANTQPPSSARSDGPTLYQALGQLNSSVQSTLGGPWTLYTIYGVAAPVPFSPNALGWFMQNQTVNSCGALFNGVTLWNGSIPLFNGTFNSGTAPFWQFMYFSNASQSILVATDVMDHVQVFPSIPMSSPCMVSSSLAFEPWGWAKMLNPLPADSPAFAESAVKAIGQPWIDQNGPMVEMYRFGSNYWGSGNLGGLVINFERCGEVGAAGVQPKASVGMKSAGQFDGSFIGEEGCGNIYSLGPPPVVLPYKIGFSALATTGSRGLTYSTFAIRAMVGNGAGGFSSDANGIVSWMVRLNLSDQSGAALPAATSSCRAWVPSIGDCNVTGQGWLAVLLSPYGSWLDSYGLMGAYANWSVPNVSLVTNQQLVIVCPAGWNLTGDMLAASTTTSSAPLNGSITL